MKAMGAIQKHWTANLLHHEVAAKLNLKKKYELPFTLLSDEGLEMLKAYDVWKEKSMYGKKYMGIERTTYIIDEKGKISEIFNKVKVDGHTEEILSKL